MTGLDELDRMTLREIVRCWPGARAVLEEAGLMNCGGEQGPDEPLGFFAQMHQVPLLELKRKLGSVISSQRTASFAGTGVRSTRTLTVAPTPSLVAEPVHRYVPFLLASVLLTLTFGATLGMINLARLTTPYFGAMTTGSVRAHAFVQVFGFVGLFVIGIACHVLPRFSGRPLAAPRSTTLILGFQIAGVLAIAAAFMLDETPLRWAWIAGSTALTAAGSMFLFVVARTIGGLPATERFRRWVIAGAAWQVVAAAGSLVAAWRSDVGIVQALWPVALWGFAGSWIFGVGRRIFGGFLGWQARAPYLERRVFIAYQAAVALVFLGEWPIENGQLMWAAAAGALGLLIVVPLFSWCLGVGSRPKTYHDVEHGYQRYITAGWVWLGAALLAGPLAQIVAWMSGHAVPLLVTDFARHALAFGFVTQVMMGVATRILPVFTGNALWSPRARTLAFHLLNASLVMRSLEAVVAMGIVPAAWPLIAFAGPPAVAAVTLFAMNVVFTIFGAPATSPAVAAATALADKRVGEILAIPGALDLLVDAGFTPLRNPVLRAAMAGTVTLRQACSLKDVPLEPLVARIQRL